MTARSRPDQSAGVRSRYSHGTLRYPLFLHLRPSRIAIALLLVLHLMVAMALLRSGLAAGLMIGAIGVVLLSAAHSLRAELRRHGRSLCLGDDGLLVEVAPGHADRSGRPVGAVDLGWAVWLRYEILLADGRPRPVALMLLPDHLERGLWRPLRVWLRHKAVTAVAGIDDTV